MKQGGRGRSKGDAELGEEEGVLTCCGLCYWTRTQRRVFFLSISLPVLVVIGLFLAILIKALTVGEKFQLEKLSDEEIEFLNPDTETQLAWAQTLGDSIKFQTISWNETHQEEAELVKFHDFLKERFSTVFSSPHVSVTTVNTFSLLLRVSGSQSTCNPYLLAAHLDVVPSGERDRWSRDPFLGSLVEEEGEQYVWGRGAIDDKHSLVGILQALEIMLARGEIPARTFYLALGHDEEVGGQQGAKEIAVKLEQMLEENDEQLDFLLDEGMTVMEGVIPGMEDPVVYIGVVEKGWTMLDLRVEGEQKHSSTPPRQSATGILAKAISSLEQHRSPAKFSEGPEYDTMSYLAPHMTFLYKLALSNLWIFHQIVSSVFAGDSSLDAVQRTTTAVTIVRAGFKDNVVPGEASAIVNHRIHPSETIEDIVKHDRDVIDDERVKISQLGYFPPPPVSPYSNDVTPFQIIANSALQVFPQGKIAPGTLVANTDTKHYLHLTSNVYRFTPAFTTKNDLSRFHGYDERISVKNYVQVVEFYHRLIRNSDTKLDTGAEDEGSGEISGSGEEIYDGEDYELISDLE